MNVKDLKDGYLGRYIKVTDTFYTYIGILVRWGHADNADNPDYAFVSVSDYWVRGFFDFDVIEFVE